MAQRVSQVYLRCLAAAAEETIGPFMFPRVSLPESGRYDDRLFPCISIN